MKAQSRKLPNGSSDGTQSGASVAEIDSQAGIDNEPRVPEQVTDLLLAWSGGDRQALTELMPLVCDELRMMARRSLGREAAGHTLQPTELVQEFFLRINGRRTVSFRNRAHFFGSAAQTMRLILVDHVRRKRRKKREAPPAQQEETAEFSFDVLALHEALGRLEAIDARTAEVVKLRFFVGMSVHEAAAALDTSPATVKRDWQFARLWLFKELHQGSSEADPADDPSSTDPA